MGDVIIDVNKTFYLGYSFEIVKETEKRFSYIVRNHAGRICDDGYSKSKSGADTKARRLIRLFNSY